ncbi:MAG TPA: diguanylate cyclase [bacterium]|nr:diguanylate cyclase [bacterium]
MGSRPPKLLVVDDEEAILDLLRRRLEALGCEVAVLSGGSQVLQTAREYLPDLVLLDVMMPDLDGFSVCEALKQDPQVRDIPVLLMTARAEVESRIKGLEMGAHDYIPKPFETSELMARVRAALRVKRLQDQLKDANRQLERLATSDALTDLPNRRTFDHEIYLAMERSRRTDQPMSVIIFDIDHFKKINDTHGHQVGDDALRLIARILAGRRRITDPVARYGGEEFVWVLPGAREDDAMQVAEWLRRAVGDMTIETLHGRLRLTVSAGITTYDPAAHGPLSTATVLEAADLALRDAKKAGRDRVVYRMLGLEEAEEPQEEDETPDVTRFR